MGNLMEGIYEQFEETGRKDLAREFGRCDEMRRILIRQYLATIKGSERARVIRGYIRDPTSLEVEDVFD